MSLIAKKKKSSIPPLEAGSYFATTIGIIDIGEQFVKYEKEKQGKYVDKILAVFEIAGECVEADGELKPRWLSKEFTNYINKRSALYGSIPAWLGRELTEQELEDGFDVSQLLGKACTVEVRLSADGEYNNIKSIGGIPKGVPVPEAQSETMLFDIDEPDTEVLEKLPEWIQNKIKKSTQWQQNAPDEALDNDTAQAQSQQETKTGGCPI